MSKYKRGVCPECKVKESDSSRKTLYQCKLCERWFCAKHFEPRLARIPDYRAFAKYPEVRVTFEEEWGREDGHPDFAYSLKRLKELDTEEKLYSKMIKDVLDRSKAYRKKTPRKDICPKCGARKQFIEEQAFNKETVSMKCKICGFKWTQPRFKEGEPKPIEEESPYPPTLPSPKRKRTWRQTLHKTLRNVKTIGILVICLVILGVFILSWTNFFAQIIMPQTVDTAQVETEIFKLINEERTNRGFPALLRDEALKTIALEWSRYMAETGDVTHGDFEDRIARIGYSYYQCGEIIAMHGGWLPTLGRAFVDMWLGSHGHREIMLTPLGGYMGVGVSKQGNHFYAVVDFRFVG